MKHFHVRLPDSLAGEADRIAAAMNRTRNGIVRLALERFLAAGKRRGIADEMRRYAESMAEGSGEFIEGTGDEVSRKILRETSGW